MTADVQEILARLIGFPSVVGTPNAAIVSYVRDYLQSFGASVHILPGPEGDRSNLFASFGPVERPGLILSGHMDVVPAEGQTWSSDPFTLRAERNRLYGRGTSDMKGFLAAAMSLVPEIAAMRLDRPLHFAFSYDEEAGCRGVPHMIAAIPALCALPSGSIVGEPSGMAPILSHKGKAAMRISIRGTAGHSSRPDLGRNAIHALAGVLSEAVRQSERLEQAEQNMLFAPPYSTLQAGIVSGGMALNVIPEHARLDIEVRAVPGIEPSALLQPVLAAARALQARGFEVTTETISDYPGMALPAGSPLAALVGDASGVTAVPAVSYGTEAGLFERAGIPAIICGPGDIARAHKADEFILMSELEDCRRMLLNVAASLQG
ncbi:acetylornithine deacetylase [Rhizobium sp. OAE497]|uniref:acetylornithine deacetylase n=1 Tax=Rhizobium sp. OAE497 TaxID=2663796 RepID=UPI0018F666F5